MATLKEMLDVAGSMEAAEKMAQQLIHDRGSEYLMDLVLLLGAQGRTDEAYEYLLKAEKEFPDNNRVAYNKGWHRMMKGELLTGFTLMNQGRADELWGNAHIGSSKPIWHGEPIHGKHLLFYCEAGLGDQIVFIRFVKDLVEMGAKVTVACDPGLAPVFARISEIFSIVEPKAMLGVYHDYWLPSMYSPVPLKKEFKDLSGKPFLTPNPHYVEKYKSIMRNEKFKIGVRWLGQSGDDYINRVFPEELLFDAVSQPGAQVYSLQKDKVENNGFPPWIIDMDLHMETWDDTMGIIANLDLVITSCTSIAHISAAMGKPTWVVVPTMMYFIWSYPKDETSPWYDSIKLFRQEQWGDWTAPFNKIKRELSNE